MARCVILFKILKAIKSAGKFQFEQKWAKMIKLNFLIKDLKYIAYFQNPIILNAKNGT
jgi:hypothetical protein